MGARILVIPAVCLAAGLLVGFFLAPRPPVAPPLSPEVTSRVPGPERIRVRPAPEPKSTIPGEILGSGRIEGRVTLPDGTPVAGAVVTATQDAPYDGPMSHLVSRRVSTEGPPDLDRELARTIGDIEKDHRHRKATRRQAISGDDGSFVLTGLGVGSHQILGFRKGYDVRRADDRGWVRPGKTVKLIAQLVIELPVSVLLPDGTPAGSAEIRMDGGFERSASWSPECSVLDVPPGTLTLSAQAGEGDLKSQPLEIEIPTTSPADQVVLELEGIQGIEGTVIFPRGVIRAFHEVSALALPPGADASEKRLLKEGRRTSISDWADRPATYRIEDLPPGRYRIGVVRHREGLLTSTIVTVGYGLKTIDFVLPGAMTTPEETPSSEKPEPASLLIRVFAPDGTPDPWVRVTAAYRNPQGGQRSLGRVKRVEPGVFRADTGGAGTSGTYLVSVRSKEYGSRDVEFDPAVDKEISVHLTEPAFVKVVLPGYIGSGYEGKTRILIDRPGRWTGSPSFVKTPPEPDGSQSFGPLTPGKWEVVLWFGRGFSPLVTRAVTLHSGPQEILLELPRVFNLDVLVEGVDGEKGYYLNRLDGAPTRGHPGPLIDGRIRFEGLYAGEYLLSRHFGPRQHMPLTITGDLTVRFVPIVLDALQVEISSPSGVLARSGLLNGDLILEIDGYEVTGASYGWSMQKLGEARGSAVLTILRNGQKLKQTVELSGLRDPERAGGELKPWRR